MLVRAILGIVVRGAGGEVVLGGGTEAEQDGGIELPVAGGHDLHRAGDGTRDPGAQPRGGGLVQQVGLVQHHQIRGQELILIDLRQRVVVVQRRVRRALGGHRLRILGEAALGHGGAVHHRHHPVHRDAGPDAGPVEGLDQRLRQGEAGGLDQDVLGRARPVEQGLHGGQELVRHGAAEAAIGQLDDVLLLAALDAAAPQRLAVDAQRAELVDDDGDAAAARMGHQVAHQRGLPGAEEAGDDGGGDLGGGGAHAAVSGAVCVGSARAKGGTRPSTTLFREAGRFEGMTTPVREAANSAP